VFTHTFPLDLAAIISGVEAEAPPVDFVGLDCGFAAPGDIAPELLAAGMLVADGVLGAIVPGLEAGAEPADDAVEPVPVSDLRLFRVFFVFVAVVSDALWVPVVVDAAADVG
jgi:hypothetical protein